MFPKNIQIKQHKEFNQFFFKGEKMKDNVKSILKKNKIFLIIGIVLLAVVWGKKTVEKKREIEKDKERLEALRRYDGTTTYFDEEEAEIERKELYLE